MQSVFIGRKIWYKCLWGRWRIRNIDIRLLPVQTPTNCSVSIFISLSQSADHLESRDVQGKLSSYTNPTLPYPTLRLDMSGTSHFWSRSRWEKNFVPVPARKSSGPGPGEKNILVPVPVKKNFGPGTGATLPISTYDIFTLTLHISIWKHRKNSLDCKTGIE
jgi:hypothetical protein